jgi:hypothetical protein
MTADESESGGVYARQFARKSVGATGGYARIGARRTVVRQRGAAFRKADFPVSPYVFFSMIESRAVLRTRE